MRHPLLGQIQIRDGFAQHQAHRVVDQLHTGRLGDERNGARCARVGLDHEELTVLQRKLHVDQSDRTETDGDRRSLALDLRDGAGPGLLWRGHTGRVPGMDTGGLDVLQDRGDVA